LKNFLRFALQYGLGIGLGIALFYWQFYNFDFRAFEKELSSLRYEYAVLGIVFMLISSVIRAYRWKLLLQVNGEQLRTTTGFFAIMAGYMVNYLVPRLGEVTRSSLVFRSDKIPLAS